LKSKVLRRVIGAVRVRPAPKRVAGVEGGRRDGFGRRAVGGSVRERWRA